MTHTSRFAVNSDAWAKGLAIVAGGCASLLGLAVVVGWIFNQPTLVQVVPSFVPMPLNVAIGFILCGLAVIAFVLPRTRLGLGLAVAAISLGTLTLLQYALGVSLGIDQLFLTHYLGEKTAYPGRMAPVSAVGFVLIGLALLLIYTSDRNRWAPLQIAVVGVMVFSIGLVACFGYLMEVSAAFWWSRATQMAIHTSLGFMGLGVGLTTFIWHNRVP